MQAAAAQMPLGQRMRDLDALVSKIFMFQFVNSYGSLFYIAYYKNLKQKIYGAVGPDSCLNDNCVAELSTQLSTIFITQMVVQQSMEFGMPYFKQYMKTRAEERAMAKAEKEAEGAYKGGA
jgi:hypothetical protein